jgi:hypothetical protein
LDIDLEDIPWENHPADIVIKGAKKVIYTNSKTGEPMILLSARADNTNIRVHSKYFSHALHQMPKMAPPTSVWRSPITIALLSALLVLSLGGARASKYLSTAHHYRRYCCE